MSVELTGVIFAPLAAGITLEELTDVTIINALAGQVLTYVDSTVGWVNADIPPTNLSLNNITGTTIGILSSTGSGVTLPSATTVAAGLMSLDDKTKLNGIATGATANAPDSYLLNRANQTGTQTASTISNLVETTQDIVADELVAGPNITIVYDDILGQITISGTSVATPGTNLFQGTKTPTTVAVDSSTGTSATLTAATNTLAGMMTGADKAKLDGIQAGATANASDLYLLNRANQTGTQTAATISDFDEAVENDIVSFLVPGNNITFDYDSVAPSLTINATGGSTIVLPATEIAFGSDLDEVISSGDLTFDAATSTLSVGGASSTISSDTNQLLTIVGDTGIDLVAPNGVITVNTGNGDSIITSGTGETLTITGDTGVILKANTGAIEVTSNTGNGAINSLIGEELSIIGDTGLMLASNNNNVVFKVPTGKLVTVFDGTTYDTILGTAGTAADPAFVTKSYLDAALNSSGAGSVISVFGRNGTVVAQAGDYAAFYATTAQGDLADTSLQPTSSINALSDVDTVTNAPQTGEALVWNGTDWVPGTVNITAPVDSVFGRTGAVVAAATDYAGIYVEDGGPVSSLVNDAGYITLAQVPVVALTSTEVAFGSGANTVTSSPDLTFDSVNDVFTINGLALDGSLQTISVTTGNITLTPESGTGVVIVGEANHPGVVESDSGQSLTIQGNAGLELVAAIGNITVDLQATNLVVVSNNTDYDNALSTNGGDALVTKSYVDNLPVASPVSAVFGRTGSVTAQSSDYSAFYATTAQGALADTATQPGNNVSIFNNDAGYITSAPVTTVFGRTGVVTAQATDYAAFYATASQGALATSAVQPFDSINVLVDVDTITNTPTLGQVLAWNGSLWVPTDDANTDAVASVFGRTGAVVAAAGDYAAFYATSTVADGEIALGSATANAMVGDSTFTFVNGVLTVDSLTIDGATQTITSTADVTILPGAAGNVIIGTTGSGEIVSEANETMSLVGDLQLTLKSNTADIVCDVPAANVVKVSNGAAYDAALALDTGEALVTKSYMDSVVAALNATIAALDARITALEP